MSDKCLSVYCFSQPFPKHKSSVQPIFSLHDRGHNVNLSERLAVSVKLRITLAIRCGLSSSERRPLHLRVTSFEGLLLDGVLDFSSSFVHSAPELSLSCCRLCHRWLLWFFLAAGRGNGSSSPKLGAEACDAQVAQSTSHARLKGSATQQTLQASH